MRICESVQKKNLDYGAVLKYYRPLSIEVQKDVLGQKKI
jgi:hypothetical protein